MLGTFLFEVRNYIHIAFMRNKMNFVNVGDVVVIDILWNFALKIYKHFYISSVNLKVIKKEETVIIYRIYNYNHNYERMC
jgi:hypothetical protein